MDDARALDKKPGSTSDRSCSETFYVPNTVRNINTPLFQAGMQPTVSRGDPRASARQGGVTTGFTHGTCWGVASAQQAQQDRGACSDVRHLRLAAIPRLPRSPLTRAK
jgi:hypothetical protein